MSTHDDDDFFVEDESDEELRAAWKAGEAAEGVTRGPRDLNQRAKSVVDQAIARWEAGEDEDEPAPIVRVFVAHAGTTAGEATWQSDPGVPVYDDSNRTEREDFLVKN